MNDTTIRTDITPIGPGLMAHVLNAVYLGDPEPETPAWLALRAEGITGTDIRAIVGEDRRRNALTVWHEKRGTAIADDDPAGEAAEWGNILEPVVATEWARRHRWFSTHADGVTVPYTSTPFRGGIWRHHEASWMRAQLDYLLPWCPDVGITDAGRDAPQCALEIKTRNQFVAGRWRDDVPDDVLAQVAWQRMVTGLDHVHVACLIGGQRLVEHTYRRDAELEAYIAAAAAQVWDHVERDTPPEVDWDDTMVKLLDVMIPNRSGARELTTDEATSLLALWEAKQAAEDQAMKVKGVCDSRILRAFGDLQDGRPAAEVLSFQGENLFTYKQIDRRGYTVAPTTYRALQGPRREKP